MSLYSYLDESLRWLVANGRKEEAVRVLERAARVNRKDLSAVLKILQDSEAGHERAGRSRTQSLTLPLLCGVYSGNMHASNTKCFVTLSHYVVLQKASFPNLITKLIL